MSCSDVKNKHKVCTHSKKYLMVSNSGLIIVDCIWTDWRVCPLPVGAGQESPITCTTIIISMRKMLSAQRCCHLHPLHFYPHLCHHWNNQPVSSLSRVPTLSPWEQLIVKMQSVRNHEVLFFLITTSCRWFPPHLPLYNDRPGPRRGNDMKTTHTAIICMYEVREFQHLIKI